MRLLNTSNFQLEEFYGSELPEYVILSHTWGPEEVTFQEFQQTSPPSHKRGYIKIQGCCAQAVRDGYEWAWIDTCCIDKSSSAELSESINSMFQWYQSARICYVFLEDCVNGEDMMECRWWTRGWTLQELIAPKILEFYNTNWKEIGTKLSLHERITEATGIDWGVLNGVELFYRNVAVRMSWAANRKTTRKEDQSYCLLGLFGVNMPLLYGEGDRAFRRLQEEIMKKWEDYTLFVWCPVSTHLRDGPGGHPAMRGLLAETPEDFVPLKDHWSSRNTSTSSPSKPWAFTNLSRNCFALLPAPPGHETPYMTSRGLRITLPIFQEDSRISSFLACLTVVDEGSDNEMMACVELIRHGRQSWKFIRRLDSNLKFLPLNRQEKFFLQSRQYKFRYQTIYVSQPLPHKNLSTLLNPRASPIALLMVDYKNRCGVDLQCLISPWLSMADLLALDGESGVERESSEMAQQGLNDMDRKSAQDRLRGLDVFLKSRMAKEGSRASSLNEVLATHCFAMAPEHCWFVGSDSRLAHQGIRVRGFLGFGSLQHAHCAFRIQIGLFEGSTMCNVVGSRTESLQDQTNQGIYMKSAQEAEFNTDRTSLCLKSENLSNAEPSFELTVSLRQVAMSRLGIKRYLLSITMSQCDVPSAT